MNLKHIRSFLTEQYRGLDKGLLNSAFILLFFGVFLTFAASPGVAARDHFESYHFIKRQLVFILPAIVAMIGTAFFPFRYTRRVAAIVLFFAIIGMVGVLFFGVHTKGASRWISLFGVGVQPSEFAKPAFAVVCAWLLASARLIRPFHGYLIAIGLVGIIEGLLYLQPDFGMILTVAAIFAAELFLSGIALAWMFGLGGVLGVMGLVAYCTLGHVRTRINRFLFPEHNESAYQVEKSLETLKNAGWFGKGPGEGVVKYELPDAHTDFIVAVSAEEFGFIITAALMGVFAFIVLRGFWLIRKENNLFCQIAVGGLLTQIAFQAIVNMGSTLNVLPTKGMTLPFISYGGSSLVSVGIAFGFILALTRRHTLSRGLE